MICIRRTPAILASLLLAASVIAVGGQTAEPQKLQQLGQEQEQDIDKVEWWKRTNFYHIYVRSFKDSNGDGQGDLRGIIDKLDYLQELGVETLLMSPFYSSPMRDGGYDIDNFVAVNPIFGSMQDFDELLSKCKSLAMRIVIDFVPNHTSDKHPWFECSERALRDVDECGQYKDYYYWSDSMRFNGSYPNNWRSVFGTGSAWSWSQVRRQFYLHQFLREQPELNMHNPDVRDQLKRVARFWLEKGVHGLRVDSVPFLLERSDGWPDEPPSDTPNAANQYDRLDHVHTFSVKGSAEVVRDWHQLVEELKQDQVIIDEAYDSAQKLVHYHGASPSERYADMVFAFDLFALTRHNLAPDYVERRLMAWYNATKALRWAPERGTQVPWHAWVLANHDQPRPVHRLGEQNMDFYQWLIYLAPNSPVAYYGEELAMQHADYSEIPAKTLEEGESSRLLQRAAMAWDASEPSGGFSSSPTAWMPPPINYRTHNVETMQRLSSKGVKNHLLNFKSVQKLRKQYIKTIVFGSMQVLRLAGQQSSSVFAMIRSHETFGSLLLLANLNQEQPELIPANESLPKNCKVLLINRLFDSQTTIIEGNTLETLENLQLGPSQVVVFGYGSSNQVDQTETEPPELV